MSNRLKVIVDYAIEATGNGIHRMTVRTDTLAVTIEGDSITVYGRNGAGLSIHTSQRTEQVVITPSEQDTPS